MRGSTDLEDRTPAAGRRPLAVIALVAAVVIVGAVAAAYLLFFRGDERAPLTLTDQPASTAPAGAPAADLTGTWRVAEGSEAGYRVREKLAALPAESDAVGRSPGVTGSVEVERSGGSLVATGARFEVDLRQLESDESRRDNRIRSDGLETDRFPTSTFVSTGPIPLPDDVALGQVVNVPAEGDLTLHGVTRRVTIPLEVRVTGDRGEVAGSLTFPMSDFAIDPPNIGGFVTVEPEATLEFRLLLEKA